MRQPDDTKSLKVQLPVHQHITLRTLKLVSNHTMSEIVERAISDYFTLLEERGDLPVDTIPAPPDG